VVLDGQRAVPERLTALGFNFRFSELEPALRNVLD
jgi:NAD dependent epimerase/dehydratase family enzyme